jgi:hypothetical protein
MPRSVMQMRPSYPSLWEERIEARGQHVLWYSATSCFCVSDAGRVDPNCPKCFGRGFLYSPVKSTRRIVWSVANGKPVVDVSSLGIKIKDIYRAYVGRDVEIEVESFTPASTITKGVRYTLDFEESFEESYTGACSYEGHNLVNVPIHLMNNQNYFAGALIGVTSLRNVTTGKDMVVEAFWANKILTSSSASATDVLSVVCEYVKAKKFLVTSINPKTKLENNLIMQNADAMMSYPGTYHVGRGDVVVLQLAEMKETIVGVNDGPSYVFPYASIARILSVEDRHGPITDYTLIRDNEIVWGARIPTRFSCAFTYHPAFAVLEDLPTVRYSEDKIWPKRVFLKKFSTFSHSSKVLELVSADIGDTGLLDDPNKADELGGII